LRKSYSFTPSIQSYQQAAKKYEKLIKNNGGFNKRNLSDHSRALGFSSAKKKTQREEIQPPATDMSSGRIKINYKPAKSEP